MHPRAVLARIFWAIHLEPFDYIVHALGLLTTIVLVALVESNAVVYSWYIVFAPLLVSNGISAYFQSIIFFRLRAEGYESDAWKKGLWVAILLGLLTAFELLLAANLQSQTASVARAITPLIVLLVCIIGRTLVAANLIARS